MRVFVSAGEPSGDLHGANLTHALLQQAPDVEVVGFGGERMATAGAQLLFPLAHFAVSGIAKVLTNLPTFSRLLSLADRFFRTHRPDALVMIDYPGFHWWLARAAKERGIPVVYFVPPQIWGWATWRHTKMRRLVDEVLSGLPFEVDWLRRRHIPARFIGHPYFDELHQQRLDAEFLRAQRCRPETVVALLPGSRSSEVHYNLGPLLRSAALIHAQRPEVRFLAACFREAHQVKFAEEASRLDLPIEAHTGRTPEIIELAHSCLAVSGSVGLELLFRLKPSVVVYHHHWTHVALIGHVLLRSPYISLVNLLAEKRLFPEYYSAKCLSETMAEHVLHWLQEPAAHANLVAELTTLRDRVAAPGACQRAAQRILEIAGGAALASRAA
jgi:lipid-A-disaccharide synthase